MSETARDRACGIISGGRVKALEDAGLVVVEQEWVPSLRASLGRCEAERDFERQRADGLAFNLEWETRDATKAREESARLRGALDCGWRGPGEECPRMAKDEEICRRCDDERSRAMFEDVYQQIKDVDPDDPPVGWFMVPWYVRKLREDRDRLRAALAEVKCRYSGQGCRVTWPDDEWCVVCRALETKP